MKKLMKRHGCAKVVTTDGLRSYRAAMKELNIADRQEVGRWANNVPRSARAFYFGPNLFTE